MNKEFFSFDGRASKAQYQPYGIAVIIASVVSNVIGVPILSLIIFLFSLAMVPIGVRRIHDGGKSGWFILVPFYNLYLFFGVDGEEGDNQYGSPPGQEPVKPW